MKKAIPLFAWLAVSPPTFNYDAQGNLTAVSMCATDSVAGMVCADVTASDVSLAVNGSGDLVGKTSIRSALRSKLNAKRTERLAEIAAQNAEDVKRNKISLTPPSPGALE